MRTFRRFIAFLLACLAVILFPLAIWVGSGTNVLLDAETYTQGLAEQNIYNDILPITLPVLANESFGNDPDSPTMQISSIAAAIPPNEWRAIANDLVPPQWLQNQVEGGLESFFTWLRGDSETMSTGPDFTVVQQRLTGEEGRQAVEDILSALPMCTGEQIAVFREIEEGSNAVMPACRPPEDYLDTARERLTQTLDNLALVISADKPTFMEIVAEDGPAQEDVTVRIEPPGPPPEEDTDLQTLRLGVEAYEQMIALFYLCPAALIALIITVAVRSFPSFASWVGWTGIISGVFALIPLMLIPLFILGGLSSSLTMAPNNAEANLFATRLVTGLLVSAFGQLSGPVLVQSLCGIGGGGLLLILGFFIARRKPAAPPLPPSGGSSATMQNTMTITVN